MRRFSALVSSRAMVVALAIDWPTSPFSPDIGTNSATRWRVSSVGSSVAVGSGAGVAAGGGAVGCDLGITWHPARSAAKPMVAKLRRLNHTRFMLADLSALYQRVNGEHDPA